MKIIYNVLQRAGPLPTVWIPPAHIRDKRELPRTRMVFARERTKLKNHIHSDSRPGVSCQSSQCRGCASCGGNVLDIDQRKAQKMKLSVTPN